MRRLAVAVLALAMLVAACDRIVELERNPPPDAATTDAINDAVGGDGGLPDAIDDAFGDAGVGPDA